AVEARAVTGDVPGLLEPLHALHHRGPRQPHLVGERLVARAAIAREQPQNLAIDGVELALHRHLAASFIAFPTPRSTLVTVQQRIIRVIRSPATIYPFLAPELSFAEDTVSRLLFRHVRLPPAPRRPRPPRPPWLPRRACRTRSQRR